MPHFPDSDWVKSLAELSMPVYYQLRLDKLYCFYIYPSPFYALTAAYKYGFQRGVSYGKRRRKREAN